MISLGFSETFSAMSDPTRRKILTLLRQGRLSAGEIGKNFDISNAAISYHLAQLKKAELIRESKYKNFIYYELNTSIFEELLLWLKQFEGENRHEE